LVTNQEDSEKFERIFICSHRPARSGSEGEEEDDEGLHDFIVDDEGKPIGKAACARKYVDRFAPLSGAAGRPLSDEVFGTGSFF
jgi:hypothetical protein